MRTLVLSFMYLMSWNLFGQNDWIPSECSPYILTYYDEITGENSTKTLRMYLSDTLHPNIITHIKLYGNENVIFLWIKTNGECTVNYATIHFLFTDTTRLQLSTGMQSNCIGLSSITFSKFDSYWPKLNILKNKKIKAIRVETKYPYCEKYFTTEEAETFIKILNCLLKIPADKDN